MYYYSKIEDGEEGDVYSMCILKYDTYIDCN